MNTASSPLDYLPIVLMFLVALGFVITTMIASHWLGPKRKTKIKLDSFECGVESEGNARLPLVLQSEGGSTLGQGQRNQHLAGVAIPHDPLVLAADAQAEWIEAETPV